MAASGRFLQKQVPLQVPKQVPTDAWSLREKLALACSVKRSGDNNWVSVSRAIKPYGESNRPSDWFSQRNCALQYSDLLEKVETPNRRKRGEKELATVEAPKDVIARKLAIERIEELKHIVQVEQRKYHKLKQEVEQILSGELDDDLDTIQGQIDSDKKAVAEEQKKWVELMSAREEAKRHHRLGQALKIKVDLDDSQQDSPADTISMEEDSNLSQGSESTPQSASSLDVKPGAGQLDVTQLSTAIKQEPDLIAAGDIKLEPADVDLTAADVTVKDEPSEAGDCNDVQLPSGDKGEESDISEDNSSTLDTFPVTRDDRKHSTEAEIFVQVEDEKDEKDSEILDSASEGPSKEAFNEPPISPASSIMSNDTDGASSVVRGRGRRRGGKNRRGRRSLRSVRGRNVIGDDRAKESETSSKAESSDEEGADTMQQESDDTASNATGRNQLSFTESVPNSPASIAPGDTEDEKAFKVWKKSIMLVWRAAANHKYTNVFSHPVREEIAPGYHSIVYRPLDLSTIKKNIESGGIRTTSEFQRDMMQMFTNAIMYNNSDHDVYHMAMDMYDDVMRHIEQYVHTQIILQGGDSKLLRVSRRSEVHSDKEDEPKRKRTTSDQDSGQSKKRK